MLGYSQRFDAQSSQHQGGGSPRGTRTDDQYRIFHDLGWFERASFLRRAAFLSPGRLQLNESFYTPDVRNGSVGYVRFTSHRITHKKAADARVASSHGSSTNIAGD